jgi:hypothetical protein
MVEWLDSIRRERGLGHRAFARLLGVSHGTWLNAFDSGHCTPKLAKAAWDKLPEHRKRICELWFGSPMDEGAA